MKQEINCKSAVVLFFLVVLYKMKRKAVCICWTLTGWITLLISSVEPTKEISNVICNWAVSVSCQPHTICSLIINRRTQCKLNFTDDAKSHYIKPKHSTKGMCHGSTHTQTFRLMSFTHQYYNNNNKLRKPLTD